MIIGIERYIGVPYLDHGRSVDGADCWGLVRLVYREMFGIALPDLADRYVSAEGDILGISETVREHRPEFFSVNRDDAVDGDIVLIMIRGYPVHVGLFIRPSLMLHTMAGRDATLESLDTWRWRHRSEGIYRHRSLLQAASSP